MGLHHGWGRSYKDLWQRYWAMRGYRQRYQNGFGLVSDLKQCLRDFEENGDISPFILAQKDFSNRFIIPQRLYGREKDVKTLIDAFEDVCNGAKGLILVAGNPGIGKSALVKEIHKPVVAKKGYFISGKYEQCNYRYSLHGSE